MRPLPGFLGLLFLLYFCQGLPFGLLVKGLPAIAREQGLAVEFIGLLALPATPWALKFLWAPLVDRLGSGRRRHRSTWIMAMQGSAVMVLVILSFFPASYLFGEGFWLFMVALTLLNALFATHDVATDGLAVRLLPARLRGPGNSIQSGGYKVGLIAGGALLLVAVEWLGWSGALRLLALLLACLLLPVWRYQEPVEVAPQSPSASGWWWRSLVGFWWRPGMLVWLPVLALYKVGDSFGSRMIKPMLVDAGWSFSAIAQLDVASALTGLVGVAVGGVLMLMLPRLSALLLFACLQALAFWGWSRVSVDTPTGQVWLVSMAEQFADGLATVALFTMMMDRCRQEHEGADYTQQASVLLAASGLFTLVSGFSAGWLGYASHFLVSAGLCLIVIIPALRLSGWTANDSGQR